MSAVNFYLKKKEESTGKSLIYLQFKYSGYKLVYSFGQSIAPVYWNSDKQRVKSNRHTTADGKHSLNDLLNNLEEVCLNAYNTELKSGFPSPATIRQHLVQFMHQNEKDKSTPTLYNLIARFTSGEIKNRGKEKAKSTIIKYKTALKHLQAFEMKSRYKLDFDTINLDFFYKYVTYLKTQGLSQNSIAKQIDIVKTFMNEAFDLGLTQNVQHKNKKFSVSWEETSSLYLTEKEIIKLFEHNFPENKRLEYVKDLFVFGCCVGLRFSDYSEVKPSNLIEIDGQKFIDMYTRKTGERVIIPCNPIVLKIFDKYAGNANKLPKSISNQKFNNYIKEACRDVGMKEKGRLADDPEKELWQCISSHTCRRSFATNLYMEGFPTIEIMKITGHKTEKAFLTYIKVSKLEAAKKLSKHMQLKWSEKLLKVV